MLKKNLLLWCLLILFPIQCVVAQGDDASYKMQGEYTGTLNADGEEFKYGIQVIALGDKKFTGVGYLRHGLSPAVATYLQRQLGYE